MKSDRSIWILDFMHIDLYNPIKIPLLRKVKHILQFIDDNSKYGLVYFIKSNFKVL